MIFSDEKKNPIFIKDIPSTNSFLMNLVREKRLKGEIIPHLLTIYTDYQSQGRGAGSNKWFSTRGSNILTSICFEPHLSAAEQFIFNLYFAVATKNFIAKYIPDVKIKWPNDMYIGDRKIAGDLTEHSISGGNIVFTIAGIGIDINEEKFPEEIPNPTSFFIETGRKYDIDELMTEYLQTLEEHLPMLTERKEDVLRENYMKNLYQLNEPHNYLIENKIIIGIIRDIDNFGRLIVENFRTGEKHVCEYKQIKYL